VKLPSVHKLHNYVTKAPTRRRRPKSDFSVLAVTKNTTAYMRRNLSIPFQPKPKLSYVE